MRPQRYALQHAAALPDQQQRGGRNELPDRVVVVGSPERRQLDECGPMTPHQSGEQHCVQEPTRQRPDERVCGTSGARHRLGRTNCAGIHGHHSGVGRNCVCGARRRPRQTEGRRRAPGRARAWRTYGWPAAGARWSRYSISISRQGGHGGTPAPPSRTLASALHAGRRAGKRIFRCSDRPQLDRAARVREDRAGELEPGATVRGRYVVRPVSSVLEHRRDPVGQNARARGRNPLIVHDADRLRRGGRVRVCVSQAQHGFDEVAAFAARPRMSE